MWSQGASTNAGNGDRMIIVKVGGAEGIDYDNLLADLVRHENFILVHGGKEELRKLSEGLSKPPRWVKSVSGYTSRATDRETIEMFQMAYCGKMNKMIVEKMQNFGVNAIGLSGMDGRLVEGKRKATLKIMENGKKMLLRDQYTGKPEKVNVELLKLLMNNGFMPVVTPPAISYENEPINIDGDRMASLIAQSLEAETLILFSNVPGLLKDVNDPNSLIKNIDRNELDKCMEYAKGTMKKKVMGAQEALDGGVKRVIFASANVEDPVTNALNGNGTVIE